MKLDLKKIEQISCIQLDTKNEERLKKDIEETLRSIQSLLSIDLSGEEEFKGFGKGLLMHEDIVKAKLPQQKSILMNSQTRKNMFVVPQVVKKGR